MPQLFFLPIMFLLSGITVEVTPVEPSYSFLVEEPRDSFYIDTGGGMCFVALPPALTKPSKNCGMDRNAFDIHTNCDFKSFKISIVNEADVLVFESDNPNVKWTGCNGYHAFPQGGYYYTIKYKISTSKGTVKGKLEKGFSLTWYFGPNKY